MNLESIQELITNAEAILITAGAGMGVDSGLPDFRGNEGFWKAYPPIAKMGISFSEMANPRWFESDPKLAWAFYGHRLNLYRETLPHKGFEMLLDLVKEKNENYFIYTSNVDGQFQKAGFDAQKINEIHGSIHHFQCTQTPSHGIWSADDESIDVDMERFEAKSFAYCPQCNAIARPNILMFGDWGWSVARSNVQAARYNKWLKNQRMKKLVIIEVGAGTAIPSVRLQGEAIAKRHPNATLIRINPREFDVDEKYGVSIALGGLEGIKTIKSIISGNKMSTEDFKNLTEQEFAKKLERHNELIERNKLTVNDIRKFTDNLTPRQRKIYSDDIRKKWNDGIDEIITIMKKYSKE